MNIQPRIGHAERADLERGQAPQVRKGLTNAVIHAVRDAARRLTDRVGISPRAKAAAMIGSGLSLLSASVCLVTVASTEVQDSGAWVAVFGALTMASCGTPLLLQGLDRCKSEAAPDPVDAGTSHVGVPDDDADDPGPLVGLDLPEQERSATDSANSSSSKDEA